MLARLGVIALVFGLIATLGAAQDQTTTKSEPSQSESASDAEDKGEAEAKPSLDLEPALKGIERAIRDLKAQVDKEEQKRQRENSRRDLEAQESMAWSSEIMFYAAFASVVLTAMALWAIICTLNHTRRAAEASEQMVNEARATTRAAIKAAEHAGREADIAEKTLSEIEAPRLYPKIKESDALYNRARKQSQISYTIVNLGRTPAVVTGISEHLGLTPGTGSMSQVYIVIPPGENNGESRSVSFPSPEGHEVTNDDTIYFRVQFTVLDSFGTKLVQVWKLVKRGRDPFSILNRGEQ